MDIAKKDISREDSPRKRIESHHFRPQSDEQEDPIDPENPV